MCVMKKIKSLYTFTAVALLSALLSAGCGGGDKKDDGAAAKDGANAPVAIKDSPPAFADIKPPQAFSEAARQREFETLFEKAKGVFEAPVPGMLVRAIKTNGEVVVGELIRYTANGLVISTADSQVTINQKDLTPENQAELFLSAFAEQMARGQMESPVASSPGAQEFKDVSMRPPSSLTVSEVRFINADRMMPRAGPGRHFAGLPENILFRGVSVGVLDSVNDWICVKENNETSPVLGWIPRHASGIPFSETDRDRVSSEVDTLKTSGFVVSVDPSMNEAVVDSYLWRISDSVSIEGVSRLLARYCGMQKNLRVFFVVVVDGTSGHKLAEFSESRGLKVY